MNKDTDWVEEALQLAQYGHARDEVNVDALIATADAAGELPILTRNLALAVGEAFRLGFGRTSGAILRATLDAVRSGGLNDGK